MDAQEPLILSVETATRAGSVSLSLGARTLCSLAGDAATSHSSNLIAQVNELFDTSGKLLSDVDLFAAAVGPGSFTGLRIGLATIKGFAISLERRCAGVSTLAAIAFAAGPSERTLALLPAGRGEVFAQLFRVTNQNDVIEEDEAAHLGPAALLERYGHLRSLTLAGEGSRIQQQMFEEWTGRNSIKFVSETADGGSNDHWRLAPPEAMLAEAVAAMAWKEFVMGRLVSAQELHAVYVRPSDAEIK